MDAKRFHSASVIDSVLAPPKDWKERRWKTSQLTAQQHATEHKPLSQLWPTRKKLRIDQQV